MSQHDARPNYQQVIDQLGLIAALTDFDPVVIGTPPLGIAIEDSDIDIACSASDLSVFAVHAREKFEHFDAFEIHEIQHLAEPACVAKFHALNWDIELFCQTMPTREQWGVRHFHIEQRLLKLFPVLKSKVITLKQDGMKTEPAFAQLLGLKGDPYTAMLELEIMSDDDIKTLYLREGSK